MPWGGYRRIEKIIEKKITNIKLILILILLLMPFVSVYINGFTDIWAKCFGYYPCLSFLFGILGSLGIILFFKVFIGGTSEIVKSINRGAILIIALHALVLRLFIQYNYDFLHRIFFTIVCFDILYLPIVILLKICPSLLGQRSR